ncbi:MAG: DEAD/DEAH box helicase, partial [Spirochaetae bacterium HGW-Spirochaetae-8]
KFDLFLRIMAKENPTNALIFTNTKAKAVEISKRLNVNGYTTQYLMGDLPQSKRLQVINRMKSGELRFLVATDVAARGLQIDDLEFVVNYDIPEDFESYVHRIGRTARAGKSGKAIMLACEQFVYGLEAIENYIQMKIPVLWADEETLPPVEDKSAKMRFRDLVDESEYASRSNSSGPRSRNASGRGKGAPGGRPRSGDSRKPRPSAPRAASAPIERPAPRTTTKSTPRAQASGKPVSASRPKPVRNDKSYNDIQKMDFEERIAYYKQVYSTEGKPTVASDAPKASPKPTQKPRPRPQAGVQGDSWEKTQAKSKGKQPSRTQGSTPQGKPQAKPQPKQQARPQSKPQAKPTAVEAAPQKKQGLLARLFKRKKGDA